MSLLEFIFVRHGESAANRDNEIARPETPLTDKGREQAHEVGRQLKDADIAAIVCSPYVRAFETAKIIAGELLYGIEDIQIIDELRERDYGQLIGKRKEHPSEWYFTVDGQYGVESNDALFARMQLALEKICKTAAQDGLVLVVGHAVSGFALLQVAAGKRNFAESGPVTVVNNAGYIRIRMP